jgi:hypothetical protein
MNIRVKALCKFSIFLLPVLVYLFGLSQYDIILE